MRRLLVAVALVAGGLASIAVTPSVASAQQEAPVTPPFAQADNPTLVVNGTGDGADASGADGVCATASGNCTLRAAIDQANYNRGSDRIEFNIPGSGTHRINIGSPLPTINDPSGGVTIDGYTEGGARANTAARGSNASIRVEVDGRNEERIFLIESAENTIRGLALFGANEIIELRNEAADGNVVIGNHIGTTAAATYTRGGGVGVIMNLGPDRNRIGTPALADRNVISGNGSYGIRINHGETSENRIQNNVIGLSPNGTTDMGHSIGVDIQWWTWGNLVGGNGPNELNVIGGNNSGVDLSHKATGNSVIGNYVGTTLDGNGANSNTRNGRGLIIKDTAEGNYFADNIVAGASNDYAIWHKHNYSGPNAFVDNRIGVGVNGADIGSSNDLMILRGHDDVYYGNTFANSGDYTIVISNTSVRDAATPEPDEQTLRNAIRRGTYYNNPQAPITFGSTCCPHPNEDTPDIDGIGPGQVNGDATCAGCEVEVYVSGTLNANGTITPGTGTTGLTWIGTVYADNGGNWSMASPDLKAGARVAVAGITPSGESSNLSGTQTIPTQGNGLIANPDQPTTVAPPAAPPLPAPYEPEVFTCSFAGGVLSWDDAGAPEYYVFATTGGTESYLGGHSATSLSVGPADSYRVEHWITGGATNAVCDGGGGAPGTFSCSVSNGVLSWTDVGAPEYYVFATTTPGGGETYLGGHSATSLSVSPAVSYRVEHWITGGVTNAVCDGDAPAAFTCSVSNGVLSWTDVGAPEYYVFATTGGAESYLGGHSATSLSVAAADSYRVEHWITGGVTNAICAP